MTDTTAPTSTATGAPVTYWLRLQLLSDTTFGRGDGVAGLVDEEVQHDAVGLPYLGGKTLKGLLAAECAEILFALSQLEACDLTPWTSAAQFLFGQPGSQLDESGWMAVGDARLPSDLYQRLAMEFMAGAALPQSRQRVENLEALTAIRRQTAVDAVSGAPQRNTLRNMRVIIRGTVFDAQLTFTAAPPDHARWLLAACTKAFRRAGTGRNRGRGHLYAELYASDPATFLPGSTDAAGSQEAQPVTSTWFTAFQTEVSQ